MLRGYMVCDRAEVSMTEICMLWEELGWKMWLRKRLHRHLHMESREQHGNWFELHQQENRWSQSILRAIYMPMFRNIIHCLRAAINNRMWEHFIHQMNGICHESVPCSWIKTMSITHRVGLCRLGISPRRNSNSHMQFISQNVYEKYLSYKN